MYTIWVLIIVTLLNTNGQMRVNVEAHGVHTRYSECEQIANHMGKTLPRNQFVGCLPVEHSVL